MAALGQDSGIDYDVGGSLVFGEGGAAITATKLTNANDGAASGVGAKRPLLNP